MCVMPLLRTTTIITTTATIIATGTAATTTATLLSPPLLLPLPLPPLPLPLPRLQWPALPAFLRPAMPSWKRCRGWARQSSSDSEPVCHGRRSCKHTGRSDQVHIGDALASESDSPVVFRRSRAAPRACRRTRFAVDTSSDDDVEWRRARQQDCAAASSSTRRPWQCLSGSSDSEPMAQRRPHTATPTHPKRKPVVDLTITAMQLSSSGVPERALSSYEEWGSSHKRIENVLRQGACSCARKCSAAFSKNELESVCVGWHRHLGPAERQWILYTLCQQALPKKEEGADSDDGMGKRVQWSIQGLR